MGMIGSKVRVDHVRELPVDATDSLIVTPDIAHEGIEDPVIAFMNGLSWHEPVMAGVVAEAGPGCRDVRPGDVVLFAKYNGLPFGDTRYIDEDCIVFIAEQDEAGDRVSGGV